MRGDCQVTWLGRPSAKRQQNECLSSGWTECCHCTSLHITIIHLIHKWMLTQSPEVKHLLCVCRLWRFAFQLHKKAATHTHTQANLEQTKWLAFTRATDATPSEQLAQQLFELSVFGFLLAVWLSWSILNALFALPLSWAADHTLT